MPGHVIPNKTFAPAPPAGVTDDFSGSGALVGRTPSSGGDWGAWTVLRQSGAAAFEGVSGGKFLVQTTTPPGGSRGVIYTLDGSVSDNFEIELAFALDSAPSFVAVPPILYYNGIVISAQDSDNYWIIGDWDGGSATKIISVEGSIPTERGSNAVTRFTRGKTLKVSKVGSTRTVYVDDVQIMQTTYSFNDSATQHGLSIWGLAPIVFLNNYAYSNFSAATL